MQLCHAVLDFFPTTSYPRGGKNIWILRESNLGELAPQVDALHTVTVKHDISDKIHAVTLKKIE